MNTIWKVSGTTLLLILLLALPGSAAAHNAHCETVSHITVKHRRSTRHQRRMTTRVLNVGRRHHANRRVQISAIITITQESSSTNLAGGHGSSVGLFQIIDMHGSYAQRHDPEWAAHWYYVRAININRFKPWLTPGQLAQAVQRSAFPGAYAQWIPEARHTLVRYAVACRR